MAAAPAKAPPVPLLWKVSGRGAQLYLLGSFHALRADDYPVADEVQRAFDASGRLLFELSPQEVDGPELAARMRQVAQRRDGSTLRGELDAATWRRLQAYAPPHGLSLEAMQGLKLWSVALSVSLAEMGRQGLAADAGLDRHFMDLAARRQLPVEGLERAADQIELLDGMAPEEQRQLLDEALDDAGDGQQVRDLHDAWRRGDTRALWSQMALAMRKDYPALYRRINVERNDRWVPLLERRLQAGQGTTLVVVGALHLLGEDGVVEKLRARGYTVERICAACSARGTH
ncbi:TraB/GumN family protein [Xanthomonas sp. Kuri4-1]